MATYQAALVTGFFIYINPIFCAKAEHTIRR